MLHSLPGSYLLVAWFYTSTEVILQKLHEMKWETANGPETCDNLQVLIVTVIINFYYAGV